jgi:hypothetical protein
LNFHVRLLSLAPDLKIHALAVLFDQLEAWSTALKTIRG